MTTKENNRMNVVGVDPGVTTGLVVLPIENTLLEITHSLLKPCHQPRFH